jgi:hypothetical protein
MKTMSRKNGNGNRQASEPAAIQTDRWLAWSRRLAGRHERDALRRPALHFMLANRAHSIRERIEHWYQLSSRFLSQLNLSITSQFSTRLGRMHQTNFHGPPQNHIQWFHFGTGGTTNSARAPENSTSRLTVLRPYELRTARERSRLVESHFRPHFSTSLLTRTFVRLEKPGSSSARFETILRSDQAQLIHRTITERQHHEGSRRSFISREHKTLTPNTNIRSLETTATQSVRNAPQMPAWGQQRPDVPQLNLEHLTDQIVRTIDSRIIAHRERTGQVF